MKKYILLYIDALKYKVLTNKEFILLTTQNIIFEISIDETQTVSKPSSHVYFVKLLE